MKIKFPLYAKILFWFFLNVVFLCGIVFVLARGQLHFWMDALISGPAGGRMQEVTQLITEELRSRPQTEWNDVLLRFSAVYHVQFFVFRGDKQLAGETVTLPPEIHERVAGRRGINFPTPNHPPDDAQGQTPPHEEPRGPAPRIGPPQKTLMHTHSPSRYWVLSPMFLPSSDQSPRPIPAMLLVESESLSGDGLFFDLRSWVAGGAAVIVISALFWLPLVRGITSSISRITRATERIAEGRFDVRTQVHRQDEIGLLSEAINRMAERLSGFVGGQKRFLGDISHELCSPIARIQVALGILEQRADENQKMYLADLREEVEHMSGLVNELLSFSKASLGSAKIKLQAVALRPLVEKAVDRERGKHEGALKMEIHIADDLLVMTEPELLLRAIGNILRNAVHHAGQAGPVTISAAREGEQIRLLIEDCGPGIPAEALPRVFDPFYRLDISRTRETGGVGLGLSIVKTCVESCGGSVRCENREPHGLRVVMNLTAR